MDQAMLRIDRLHGYLPRDMHVCLVGYPVKPWTSSDYDFASCDFPGYTRTLILMKLQSNSQCSIRCYDNMLPPPQPPSPFLSLHVSHFQSFQENLFPARPKIQSREDALWFGSETRLVGWRRAEKGGDGGVTKRIEYSLGYPLCPLSIFSLPLLFNPHPHPYPQLDVETQT